LTQGFEFILVCKPESHPLLYEWVELLERGGSVKTLLRKRWTGKRHEIDTYRYVGPAKPGLTSKEPVEIGNHWPFRNPNVSRPVNSRSQALIASMCSVRKRTVSARAMSIDCRS
jgi:hypothetical protein